MTLKNYIKSLQDILDIEGDLEVQTSSYGIRREASNPEISYERILKGRESTPLFL